MLVLQRKIGEKIYIGPIGNPVAIVTVVDYDRGKIRVGVEASKEMPIFREELLPPESRAFPTLWGSVIAVSPAVPAENNNG